ncbi:MAG: phosphotransferase [Bacteroidota bacterium]
MQLSTETNLDELTAFLSQKGILETGENIQKIEKPGEGNMNVVIRITTGKRSLIAKQSKPFVQKYQDIPAPIDRILVEHTFYKTVKNAGVNAHLPKVIGFLPEHHMLFMDDLGNAEDMSFIYEKREMSDIHLEQLVTIAKGMHQSEIASNYPKNLELRQLNHQHIFVLPFMEDNGFSLDDVQNGLKAIAQPFVKDETLKEKVQTLGELYLSMEGGVLLHGDYYPGSWMVKDDHVFVLDPEFSYAGPKEFDLGVMIAHLFMATANATYLDEVIHSYNLPVDIQMTKAFAGIEVIRRLIGLAQLPLARSLEEKKYLLDKARAWVFNHSQ